MTDLMALAARVEALAGPDRAVDAAIVVALDLRPNWTVNYGPLWIDLRSGTTEPVIRVETTGKRSPGHPPIGDYPRFTASLDAALLLVPEGWAHGYRWNRLHKNARGFCEFFPEPPFAPSELISVESRRCASPAIALTGAALKARASLTEINRLNAQEGV